MTTRSWLYAIVAGLSAGLLVSIPMTLQDWRLNPSSLFHSEQGTNWSIVFETASSWFSPVALPVFAMTLVIHVVLVRSRNRRRD